VVAVIIAGARLARGGAMKRAFILGIVLLGIGRVASADTTVHGGGHVVRVPHPNGVDDTAVIQSALDRCVAHGPGCTVQLAEGRYLTRQLVVYDFRGTFEGRGAERTIIEALPNLRVDCYIPETDTYWPPDPTVHPWASLIIFVDGDIRVSDLAIRITAVPSTQPYYIGLDWQAGALLDGIRFMGKHRTNATVARVAVEGREDPDPNTSIWGFNLNNAITYAGELPTGSGIAYDYYRISGTLSVSASSFKTQASGVMATVVKDGRVTIGGSPSAGNVFENVVGAIDLESLESSVVEVSHNRVLSTSWFAAWVIPWCCGFLPAMPSQFLFHDNDFRPAGESADGIILMDDPVAPWIDAVIAHNTIRATNIGYGGISVYNTKGTTVWGNRVSGSGANAIGIWNGSYARVLGNEVEDFKAGTAQIVLDPTTSHATVVCDTRHDTVLDQGTDNKLRGCRLVTTP
jgi:hypothetical protein